MSLTRYKELLAQLDKSRSLHVKAGLMVELDNVKRQISASSQKKLANLPGDLGISKQGIFCRGAYLKYRNTPLGSGPGTGRFWSDERLDSPLYFTSNEFAVFPERRETGFDIVEPHFRFWANVDLENVLDLTSADVRKALKITKYEVEKIEWSAWKGVLCPTQILGKESFDAGYEAILFNSARHKGTVNLAIFVGNLNVKYSSVIIQDSHKNFKNGRIP